MAEWSSYNRDCLAHTAPNIYSLWSLSEENLLPLSRVLNFSAQISCCVILGKLLHLSEPHFSHLLNGNKSRSQRVAESLL